MNVIISNPIISEFLHKYPEDKHVNCLLGIILFGIYNIQSLSIDFSKILDQVESSKPPSKQSSFLSRVKSQIKDEASDTPRFTSESKPEKDYSKFDVSTSHKVLHSRQGLTRRPDHMKTPSIVNPEIITDYASVENSEVLRIADQFLNGQFVNEYCKFDKPGKSQSKLSDVARPSQAPKREVPSKDKRGRAQADLNENSCASKPESKKEGRSNSSMSLNGRRNSFSVISANRSVRGDRSTSFSKFW